MLKIYLAGPEVFLPDAVSQGRRKKEICTTFGMEGLFPLDNEVVTDDPDKIASLINQANIKMIRDCDAIVANITPFRGPSADPGTAFELGFAAALGKGVYAYSNVTGTLFDRIPVSCVDGHNHFDAEGLIIENFNLADNLMLTENLTRPLEQFDAIDPRRDLTAFHQVLKHVQHDMSAEMSVSIQKNPSLFGWDDANHRYVVSHALNDYFDNKRIRVRTHTDPSNRHVCFVFRSVADRDAFEKEWIR